MISAPVSSSNPDWSSRVNAQQQQRLWHKVARGGILPTGSVNNAIPASVLNNGQIVTDSLWGPEVQGQLNLKGDYQLLNGIQGNLFVDPYLDLDLSEGQNPFVDALAATGRQRAVIGSEIPRIRQQLTSRGLNGSGIKVGILDAYKKDKKTGQFVQTPHTRAVAAIIQDPLWGVAPGAQAVDLGKAFDLDPETLPTDSYQAFVNDLTNDYSQLMQYQTRQIEAVLARKDPAMRVLNMTWGSSRNRFYNAWIDDILLARNEQNYPKYPALRKALLGPAANGTSGQQVQCIINAVDAILGQSPVVKAAHNQYVEATRKAANAGIILVGSAGNENQKQILGLQSHPGFQMDTFNESPYVISVAAADTNQQPGNRSAYTIAPFSSRGDGFQNNPTIAAPGQEMGISHPEGEMGHNLTVDGTSFATPFTCGVIAMMLQRNPYLTFEQVKAKLQATAVKSPHYGPADYGAGFLNAEAAVLS